MSSIANGRGWRSGEPRVGFAVQAEGPLRFGGTFCARSGQFEGESVHPPRMPSPAILFGFLAATMILAGQSSLAGGEAVGPSPDQVKAAFLVSFPKYVDWPAALFPATNSPIVLAVFGDDDEGAELRKMAEGKSVNGRPLEFRRVTTEDECAGGCQVLFIGNSERRRIPQILQKLKGTSVLTVGESENDDFLEKGGVINLALQGRKIRLHVSLAAAQRAQIKISSKLLSVADLWKGQSN